MLDRQSGSGTSLAAAALLVVDVQQALFERSTSVYQADTLLETIQELGQRAREAGVHIIYIRHSNKMLQPGTAGWAIHPRLVPQADDLLIDKTHGNAFQDTTLDAELKQRSVGTLYVVGLVTQGCVQATCRGGQKRGYQVTLVSDGHSTYSRDAAKLIRQWNGTLSSEIEAVRAAQDIDFAR